jgi:hypothetical protein
MNDSWFSQTADRLFTKGIPQPLHRKHPVHPADRRKPPLTLGIQQVFHADEHPSHELLGADDP